MNLESTNLLDRFKKGEKAAADALIGRYFERVVRLAEKQLHDYRLHATAGDDVAASVFESLWQRADEGRFGLNQLVNEHELWKLLCTIVRFKTRDHIRREAAQKRGGASLRGESFFGDSMNGQPSGINDVPEDQVPIADIIILKEEHDRLLDLLQDDLLRQIAVMRLDGFRVAEIAESYGRTERWVGRKLKMIRSIWELEIDSDN